MALSAKSLLSYGIEVTTLNQNLDFKISSGGSTLTAQLALGFYSPATLAQAVAYAMQSVDSTNLYTVNVIRTIAGGTQNRVTIETNGSYLSLLFGSGPNVNTSCAPLIGFFSSDYTGSVTYTGHQSTGSILIPGYIGYNYLDVNNMSKVFGAVNISAAGLKEAVTFNIQQFIEVEFKYEPKSNLYSWVSYFTWVQNQKPFDFTPEISSPNTVYSCTLEKTTYEQKGLGWQMKEMLPDYPNYYQTGLLTFRIIPSSTQFIGG